MLSYARTKDLAMVEQINEEAISKYNLPPSKFRYNSIILCLARLGRPRDAEKVLYEMKE